VSVIKTCDICLKGEDDAGPITSYVMRPAHSRGTPRDTDLCDVCAGSMSRSAANAERPARKTPIHRRRRVSVMPAMRCESRLGVARCMYATGHGGEHRATNSQHWSDK